MKIIPIFVPHVGCRHSCIFCNQRHITGQAAPPTAESVRQKVEQYLTTIDPKKDRVEVAFYGGSFTATPLEYQNSLLSELEPYFEQGLINGARVSTRPDAISDEIVQNLKNRGVELCELGVQSMDDGVLLANQRGHTACDVAGAVECLKKYGLGVGVQQMPHLYTATCGSDLETARRLAAFSPDTVRIYPTLVMEDTRLCSLYREGKYRPKTLDESVALVKEIRAIYNGIKIIRTGLLLDGQALQKLVAGPYHERYGDLCRQ